MRSVAHFSKDSAPVTRVFAIDFEKATLLPEGKMSSFDKHYEHPKKSVIKSYRGSSIRLDKPS